MEDKIRRESKKFVENMFKKMDTKSIGAIPIDCMRTIVADLVPVYNEAELEEMLDKVKKESSYVERNPVTRKFDVKKEPDTLDFPSALAIAVHFLLFHEKKENRSMSFSGRALVRLDDMPVYKNPKAATALAPVKEKTTNKRMY